MESDFLASTSRKNHAEQSLARAYTRLPSQSLALPVVKSLLLLALAQLNPLAQSLRSQSILPNVRE